MEYKESASESSEFENNETLNSSKGKNSFVWKYFRRVADKTYECNICHSCNVGNQTSNLARHLSGSHNIPNAPVKQNILEREGRPRRTSRSFIWKYCTKENAKQARCHFCKKLLYFGGGNTTNITKHLRRKHQHLIDNKQGTMHEPEESFQPTINSSITDIDRRERKGGSYVWKYCVKISRETIRCNLCNKLMSFHGTANVITHLQRRHNVIGKAEADNVQLPDTSNLSEGLIETDEVDEADLHIKTSRRSTASASIVWKYCIRISKEAVRCSFCNKNLSYQGTSNLQRHLHRMHGIVTQPRTVVDNNGTQLKDMDSNFIWEHCTLDNEKAHCKMCTASFECNDTTGITNHLTLTHCIEVVNNRSAKRRRRAQYGSIYETSDDQNDDWSKHDEMKNDLGFEVLKKEESNSGHAYECENDRTKYDEDPFDPSTLQEVPLENPLSPQSSLDGSRYNERKLNFDSEKLRKLNEERVRMETEYFREKAGYYRMQKYLTALQAKKIRVEIERMTQIEGNGTDNIEILRDQLPSH